MGHNMQCVCVWGEHGIRVGICNMRTGTMRVRSVCMGRSMQCEGFATCAWVLLEYAMCVRGFAIYVGVCTVSVEGMQCMERGMSRAVLVT